MLLKSIKLKNFRQYKDASLDFAQGTDEKNVTIIIGKNGSGKTTFLQSFFWCFYGVTYFKKDQSVLNLDIASNMTPENPAEVKVELKFQHGKIDYTFKRTQKFKKSYNNEVKPENSVWEIQKIVDGNSEFVKPVDRESVRNSILRQEVSKYFFFDGERIETMGQEIANGKRTEEFADAVKGLLGLSAMQKALEHLNKGYKNSVIGSYNDSYDSESDADIKAQTKIVKECDEKLEAIENEQEELDDKISEAELEKNKRQEELLDYKSSVELQKRKNDLNKEIGREEKLKSSAEKDICSDFNSQALSFLSLSLISDAFKIIVNHDLDRSDIPNITNKTIQYLIDHKVCLCGNPICDGSKELEKINKWFDVLPPKSIGNMVNDFKTTAQNRISLKNNFIEKRNEKLAAISESRNVITNDSDEIMKIDEKLGSDDVEEKVQTLQSRIKEYERTISKSHSRKEELAAQVGGLQKDRETAESNRKELSLKNENNRKIEIYKAYAQRIYDLLKEEYDSKEKEIRERLEKNINEIFSNINNGDLSLHINEKYQIDVFANNINTKVETSEGQSLSVIFAFITSMIKMSRENRSSDDETNKTLSSEIYPLVMDAPLSKFDKEHIKNICENIPKLAEQVVIFIKDTDGDIAKEYLSEKIGKEHRFIKINETETILE